MRNKNKKTYLPMPYINMLFSNKFKLKRMVIVLCSNVKRNNKSLK